MTFTLDDFRQLIRVCAGQEEGVDLDGDILAVELADLGYDSLALMEVAGRVERRFAVALPEEAVASVRTPGDFLALVNGAVDGTVTPSA
jgi:act minimal PKS acyl carrier protein